MFEVLVIDWSGRRVVRLRGRNQEQDSLLDRAARLPNKIMGSWDLLVVGDHVDPIEARVRRRLHGKPIGWVERVGLRLFGGVVGADLVALVQEVGLAANLAAHFRRGSRTAFVFKEQGLLHALENKGRGPVVLQRRGLWGGPLAVVAEPGFLPRWWCQ